MLAAALDRGRPLGLDVSVPECLPIIHPLRYALLVFNLTDPVHLERALSSLISIIVEARHIADFFCLVPVCHGKRLWDGAVRLSADRLMDIAEGREIPPETFVPLPLPAAIERDLPPLPLEDSVGVQVRTRALALVGNWEYIRKLHEILSELSRSEHALDHEFARREKEKLFTIAEQTRVDAEWVLAELPESLGARDQDLDLVRRFLHAIANGLIAEVSSDGEFTSDHLVAAIHSLPGRILNEQESARIPLNAADATDTRTTTEQQ